MSRRNSVSQSSISKFTLAIRLFIAHNISFAKYALKPEQELANFLRNLEFGTIDDNMYDPLGLYWVPRKLQNTAQLFGALNQYLDWLKKSQEGRFENPYVQPDSLDRRMAQIAWTHRRNNSMFRHLIPEAIPKRILSLNRLVMPHQVDKKFKGKPKAFPEKEILRLLRSQLAVDGKKHAHSQLVAARNAAITCLLHFGGIRISEAFHLYFDDITPSVTHPNLMNVKVYHPSRGRAPDRAKIEFPGKILINRSMYLKSRYGLIPRNHYAKTNVLHSGWKKNLLDASDEAMRIYWFPRWGGELFSIFWKRYISLCRFDSYKHPYAFVKVGGDPFTASGFSDAHKSSVQKAGLEALKYKGTTPHGHRHAYAQRLIDCGIEPVIIQKLLHHKSIHSQAVYTVPSSEEIQLKLDAAVRLLEDDAPCLNEFELGLGIGIENGAYKKPTIRKSE